MKISGLIVSIVMVVGLFSFTPIVSGIQTDSVSPNSSVMGLVGHAIIVVTGPDGYVKGYAQTDNAVLEDTKECMMDTISGSTLGTGCGDATTIQIGGDDTTAPDEDSSGLVEPYVDTNLTESGFAESRDSVGDPNAGSEWSSSFTFDVDDDDTSNPTGCIPDSDSDGLDECDINEVTLENGSGEIAHAFVSGTPPTAEAGDTIDVTYLIDLV